jgi:hypothetical protein
MDHSTQETASYRRRRDLLLKMIRTTQWMWTQEEPSAPKRLVVRKKKMKSDEVGS